MVRACLSMFAFDMMTSERLNIPESVADFVEGRTPKISGAGDYIRMIRRLLSSIRDTQNLLGLVDARRSYLYRARACWSAVFSSVELPEGLRILDVIPVFPCLTRDQFGMTIVKLQSAR